MCIIINDIVEPEVNLFNPEGKFIGVITNSLQFNDVRIQIMKGQLEGYYVIYNGKKVLLDKGGRVIGKYPDGLYDTWDNQINTLIGL